MEKLIGDFGNKFLIIGTKRFKMDLSEALAYLAAENNKLFVPPAKRWAMINLKIKGQVGEAYFDLLEVFCPSFQCQVFNDQMPIISYDKAHLTKIGATYLGNLLKNEYPFSAFLKERHHDAGEYQNRKKIEEELIR